MAAKPKGADERVSRRGCQGKGGKEGRHFLCLQMAAKQKGARRGRQGESAKGVKVWLPRKGC